MLDKHERHIVNNILISIKTHPEEWKKDKYFCTHKSGAKIWIASEVWGLHIEGNNSTRETKIGKVSVISWLPWNWWKMQLYAACMKIDAEAPELMWKQDYPYFY